MTYAFLTEWLDKDEHEKFDRTLAEDPRQAEATRARDDARTLMAVFGMATG